MNMSKLIKQYAGALQLVLVIAIVGGAVLLSSSLKPDGTFVPPRTEGNLVQVSVVQPAAQPFEPTVALNGVVEARTVTSIIPQVSGKVVSVSDRFRPGAGVSAGEILFVIDPADYELAVERTLAEIEVARSDLLRLEAEGAAERKIWQGRFPERPIPDLTARVPQIAAAKARIQSGEAAKAAAELNLERTIVRAPFDARILETQLDVGQVVGGNASVGRMFSIASLEIAVPVSADELRRIGRPEGRSATITPQLPTEPTIVGTVVRQSASLDEQTRLGTLYLQSNEIAALTLGEFVTVDITGPASEETYRLPSAALTSRDQVWVVEDDRLAARRVEILAHNDSELIINAFDFADGVVSIPPSDARDGLPVDIALPDGPKQSGGTANAAR
ncbi:MAG: efflux RND transporter periplasmic adaptor subunit [Woeseiaceae bacterium]|nr:efflux RND transporter periplasmic adaptor subunit [Woeseiaceae bacterium]